ncbi:putative mediator of RNA polymerase II transcription subunit 15a-like isoform X2 [Capsicum annuum]|nr:putative mediator of RNA polymerase II transcription subunit 15a-like isoform X2 [Capsicum annuum]
MCDSSTNTLSFLSLTSLGPSLNPSTLSLWRAYTTSSWFQILVDSLSSASFCQLTHHHLHIAYTKHDAIPQRPQNEQIEKLKKFKAVLERILIFLQLNKHDIQLTHKEKLCSVERHIGFFLSKPTSPPLQGQLPQSSMQLQQPQSLDVQTNPPMQPQLHQALSSQMAVLIELIYVSNGVDTLDGSSGALCSDSTSQTGNADGADWQEELYQEIKTMREKNLPELNALYQKIASKVQQHDAIPQRPQNEQIEKLKKFKAVLERILIFLQLNKHDIQLTHKEKLCSVERHIGFFLSKPTSPPLQGQLPQSSMQLQQPQSLDVQTNPPMQPQLHQALSSQAQSTGAHQTAMLESGGQDTASKSD